MGKFIDMTRQRYGRLTMLRHEGGRTWLCRCDCGVEKSFDGHSVRYGRSTSCGCFNAARAHAAAENLSGQRFGRLVAGKRVVGGKCQCICDCGGACTVMVMSLKKGDTTSCGCAHKDMMRARNAALNPKRRKPELGDLQGKDRLRVCARLYYHASEKCRSKCKVAVAARSSRISATTKNEERLTVKQWEAIVTHFDSCCAYCGNRPKKITIDHMTPICRGGAHVWQNVVPACWGCNAKKHIKPLGVALDLLGTNREQFWSKLQAMEERLSAA